MPGPEFYRGLPIHEVLKVMAEHHASEETRHISSFEYQALHKAAELLEDLDESGRPDD